MSKPLTLSIIIPAYNEEDHLGMCLDAIANQTVLPDEVIVVDNNSTDCTIDIARQYDFVRVIKENQQGIVYARGTGFDAASSDLLGRIDADTVLPADWVERVKNFYSVPENTEHVITGAGVFRNMPMPHITGWLQDVLAFWLNRVALGHHIVWGSNMVMPAATWQKVRDDVCDLPHIHEDIDLAIHLNRIGVPIMFDNKLRVSAVMRRVLTDRHNLWPNLKWWPRTLRRHRIKSWPLAVVGAGYVYVLAQIVRLGDRLRPLTDSQDSTA